MPHTRTAAPRLWRWISVGLLLPAASSLALAQAVVGQVGNPVPLHPAMHHGVGPAMGHGPGMGPMLAGRALDQVGASAEQSTRIREILEIAMRELRALDVPRS